MNTCRNAIEELVIEEAKQQIKRLCPETKSQVDLSEVVAYALNRLPTLYATTHRGWLQQRKRAHNELKVQIESAVRRAMLGVKKDVLREVSPLPEIVLEDQSRSLAKLQKLLGKENLKWKDVPAAVEDALMTVKIKGAVCYTYLSTSRRNAIDVQSYLKRSKAQDFTWKNRSNAFRKQEEVSKTTQEQRDFDSYMAKASYSFSNTLESLVRLIMNKHLQKLEPSVARRINVEEVVAYALNRLPPMYATSEHGFKQLRIRARVELSREITSMIEESIAIILEMPNRILPPLPFEKFNLEQERALEELRSILQIEDLNWRNIVLVVEDALERTLSGEITFQRRDRKLTAIKNPELAYSW